MSNILEAIQELNEDKTDSLIEELLKKYPGSELRGGRFFCVDLKTIAPTTQWEGVIAFLIKKNEKKVSLPTHQNHFNRASAGYVDQKTLDQIFGFKKALDDNRISYAVRAQEWANIDRSIKVELGKKFSKNNIPQEMFYPVSMPYFFHIHTYYEKIDNKQLGIGSLSFSNNLSEIDISLADMDDIKKDVRSISSIIDNIKVFAEHDFKGEIVTTIFNLLANECDLEGRVKSVTEIIHIDANDVPKFVNLNYAILWTLEKKMSLQNIF